MEADATLALLNGVRYGATFAAIKKCQDIIIPAWESLPEGYMGKISIKETLGKAAKKHFEVFGTR